MTFFASFLYQDKKEESGYEAPLQSLSPTQIGVVPIKQALFLPQNTTGISNADPISQIEQTVSIAKQRLWCHTNRFAKNTTPKRRQNADNRLSRAKDKETK